MTATISMSSAPRQMGGRCMAGVVSPTGRMMPYETSGKEKSQCRLPAAVALVEHGLVDALYLPERRMWMRRQGGRRRRHRFRHPRYHLRPRRWNGCKVEGPPQRLHTRRFGREGRHRARRPCHRLHPRHRRGRRRMDPLGITWGVRDRPAGGWCTQEEEMGEGSRRNTITDPPANRRAVAGGPQGGLGVNSRRR